MRTAPFVLPSGHAAGSRATRARTRFLHTLPEEIAEQCVARGVGTLVVGDLGGIREDIESGDPRDRGDHGDLDSHGWAFERFSKTLEHEAAAEGIAVAFAPENGTSKTRSACGGEDDSQCVGSGL